MILTGLVVAHNQAVGVSLNPLLPSASQRTCKKLLLRAL